jgi:hypothetical protein
VADKPTAKRNAIDTNEERTGGDSLYITAGPNDENNGLQGVLRVEGAGNRMED